MPAPDTRTLFISDKAWQRLVDMAIAEQFIKPNAERAVGMPKYIAHLMDTTILFDTRPDDVKEQDADMIDAGMLPEWIKYHPRKRRNLAVTNNTLIRACVHAHHLHISSTQRLLGAPPPFDGVKCLSLLLEGIGTNWISTTYGAPYDDDK